MFSTVIRMECGNPAAVKKSLEPDMKEEGNVRSYIRSLKNAVEITIETDKLSHMKAAVNSYISLVQMLLKVEEGGIKDGD